MAGFYTLASWVSDHEAEITAVAAVLVALGLAKVVDTALSRQGKGLSPVATTRLRLVRRLVSAVIVVIGIGIALWQFDSVKSVATGLLASSALLGLVVGFAARQTLANGIAGILLAITQPIRIGDLVTFEEETGEVEDVQLTYTYIRLDDGTRLIVPNERLAQSSVANHTILDPRVKVEVSVWLQADADADRAIELVEEEEGVQATVAEVDKDGVRLTATTWADGPRDRGRVAAELRRLWLRKLREQGLSSVVPE
jgi:small-conductance mechanosensitive channel